MKRFAPFLVALLLALPAQAQFFNGIPAPAPNGVPIFDYLNSPAPKFYCGTVRMRTAYAGHLLRLALGSNTATQLDFDVAAGTNVIDDAAVQTWLAANGNTFAWVATCYNQDGSGFDAVANVIGTDSPFYKGVSHTGLPAGANAVTDQIETLGLPSLNFFSRNNSTVGIASFLNVSGSVTANRTAWSGMAVGAINDVRPLNLPDTGTGLGFLQVGGNAGPLGAWFQGNGFVEISSAGVVATTVTAPNDFTVHGATMGTTNFCAYEDESVSGCAAHGAAAGATAGGVLGSSFNGLSPDGNFVGFVIWDSELTSAQMKARQLAAKQQISAIYQGPSALWVADGDSIPNAYFGTFSENYAHRAWQKVYNNTGKRLRLYDVAINGQCLATSGGTCPANTATSEFAAKTQTLLQSGNFNTRILSVDIGRNDLSLGATTPAALSTALTTYISNARSAVSGVKVVYNGMISGTGIDANCFTFMTDIIAAASYDALSGWYNDANMKCTSGGGTNFNNTTYFNADHFHPINQGMEVGAGYMATSLQGLLP